VAMIEPDDKVVTTSLAVKPEFSPRRVITFREACDLNAVACDVDSEVNSPGYVTVILTAPLTAASADGETVGDTIVETVGETVVVETVGETVGETVDETVGGTVGEMLGAVGETVVGDSEIKHCQKSTASTVMFSGVPTVHEVQIDEIAVPTIQLYWFAHTSGFIVTHNCFSAGLLSTNPVGIKVM